MIKTHVRRLGWRRWTALLAVALVSACGPVRTGEGSPVSFMVFGDPAELRAYMNLVTAFEASHASLDIELIHIPGQADYRRRLVADFAAGTPADVVLITYRRYSSFAANGALEPLGPYLENSQVLQAADFYPQALDPFHWRGQLICIPQNISSLAVYYNQDLFDAAGLPYPSDDWDWDDFVETARALTVDRDGDGRTDQHGLGIEPSLQRLAPFIWQNKGELMPRDTLELAELSLNEPAAQEAFQWFVDLQVRHRVVPSLEEEQTENDESRFLNGRLAMYVNSRRGVPTYREVGSFNWDVAPLPRGHGRRTSILHADAYCLPSASEQKQAAWTFIEFATSAEGQTIVARSGRTVPSLRAVAESPAFLDPEAKPVNARVFLDVIPHLRAVPVLRDWADIEEIASDEIARAFYGRATVDEAIAAAIARTEEYFR